MRIMTVRDGKMASVRRPVDNSPDRVRGLLGANFEYRTRRQMMDLRCDLSIMDVRFGLLWPTLGEVIAELSECLPGPLHRRRTPDLKETIPLIALGFDARSRRPQSMSQW